jgi:beta-alanine degradation protein BauB
MATTVLNDIGNWSFWTEQLIKDLEQESNNTTVGEKLVFENDYLKAWTIHLLAGQVLPFHKHAKKYIWTALSEGKSVSFRNDGSVIETIYNIGDTGYYDTLSEENFFIHNLINTGNSTLIFSTIEFKK